MTRTITPSISVVIPAWNSRQYLDECLQSLNDPSSTADEMVIVDNGSSDGTPTYLSRRYPSARLIVNALNEGFCHAVNQGVRATRGEWVLVLNADTRLAAGALAALAASAREASDDIGMIGPKLLRMDGQTIDSTGLVLTRARRFRDRGGGESDRGQYDAAGEIAGACAAAVLYRRAMLESIAEDGMYFDERFFALVDDVDLAWRARRAGWRAWYEPSAVVYHARNGSGLPCNVRQYLSVRNRCYLLYKHETAAGLLKDLPYWLVYDLVRWPYLLATNRLAWRALREVLRNGPTMRRQVVRENRTQDASNRTQVNPGRPLTFNIRPLTSDPSSATPRWSNVNSRWSKVASPP